MLKIFNRSLIFIGLSLVFSFSALAMDKDAIHSQNLTEEDHKALKANLALFEQMVPIPAAEPKTQSTRTAASATEQSSTLPRSVADELRTITLAVKAAPEKTAAPSSTTGTTATVASTTVATAKVTKDPKNEPKYILDLNEEEQKEAKIFMQSEKSIFDQDLKKYLDAIESKDIKALEQDSLLLNAVVVTRRSPHLSEKFQTAQKQHVKLMPKKYSSLSALERYINEKFASTVLYTDQQLANIPLIKNLFELHTLPERMRSLAAYKSFRYHFSLYEQDLKASTSTELARLNKLALKSIDYYYAVRLFISLEDHWPPYIQEIATPPNTSSCLELHCRYDAGMRKKPLSAIEFATYPFYIASKKFAKEKEELPAQLAQYHKKIEDERKQAQENREKESQARAKATRDAAEKKKREDDAAALAEAQRKEAAKKAADQKKKDDEDAEQRKEDAKNAAKERKKQAELNKRAARLAKNAATKAAAQSSTTSTTSTTAVASIAVAATAKATKDHENEPKYILDFSEAQLEEALKRGKIDDDIMYENLNDVVQFYIATTKAKNKKALADDNIVLQAHIACSTLKFSPGQKDYTQELEAAFQAHMKLFPKKWATRQALQAYFKNECSRPCYTDTQLFDVPLVHTFSELHALKSQIQPLAAFKMLRHVFSTYEKALAHKDAVSIPKLNTLANHLIEFYYAQRIFLDLNNNRKIPYMISQCSPQNFGKRIIEHYELDKQLRKQHISERDFSFQPHYLAYLKLEKEKQELQTQLARRKQEKEDSAKKQREEKEKKQQEQVDRNALKALSVEQIEAKLAVVDRQLGSYHAESEHGKHYLQQKAKFERELEERKEAAQTAAEKKKKEDEAAVAAQAKREAAETQKAEYAAKKRADRTARKIARETAQLASSQPDSTSATLKTSTEQALPVTATKEKQLAKDLSKGSVEHSTSSGSKHADQDAKEKQRIKAEKKRLRFMKYEIKKLEQEGYNFCADEALKIVRFEKDKLLKKCDYCKSKPYPCCHAVVDQNTLPGKYDVRESAQRIFEAAKGPIRLAILEGYDSDQFIKWVNENCCRFYEWDLYQEVFSLLSPIPEYASLIGQSPEDMIRNLFRIAHTQPMTI